MCVCLVARLCLTLCGLMVCSLPGSSVHRIFQARILEWVAISYLRRFFQSRDGIRISCQCKRCGLIPGSEDPLEKEKATHSSILAWKILWTEKPGGLQSMGSQRVRHDWAFHRGQALCMDVFFLTSHDGGGYRNSYSGSAFTRAPAGPSVLLVLPQWGLPSSVCSELGL